jgi:hypothetical protein
VTDRNEGGWRAERYSNCDVALANNSLRTSGAYTARFSSTLLRCEVACRRLLHASSNWILYTPALWCACVDAGACDVHLPRFNTPTVNPMLNTNNLLHVNTTSTQYTTNTIFTCNTNNTTTRASLQQVTEADRITRARDTRCVEASKTQPLVRVVYFRWNCVVSFTTWFLGRSSGTLQDSRHGNCGQLCPIDEITANRVNWHSNSRSL